MKKITQADRVLKILRENGSITNFYCIENKISIRLGAIIHDLKTSGLIELDDDKSGFLEGTKNYQYVVKPIKPKEVIEYKVEGKVVATKTIW